MWIYTKNGFYSIVEDRNDRSRLLVRARIKGDIEKAWPQAIVQYTPDHDYAYRASISRGDVEVYLEDEVESLDYDNFKAEIMKDDPTRAFWYSRVWEIMLALQEFLAPAEK